MAGDKPALADYKKDTPDEPDNSAALRLIEATAKTPGVAPAVTNGSGSLDKFLAPGAGKGVNPDNGNGRATFGTERDAQGNPISGDPTATPDFKDSKRQYDRDPNQRYETYNGGNPVATGPNPDSTALAQVDSIITGIIKKRGMAHDPVRDPDFWTMNGAMHTGGTILASGFGGLMSGQAEKGITGLANRTVKSTEPYLASENFFTRNAARAANAPASAWQTYVTGTGDMVPVKVGADAAAGSAAKKAMVEAEEAALKVATDAKDDVARLRAEHRLATLRAPVTDSTIASLEGSGLWTQAEREQLLLVKKGEEQSIKALGARKIAEPVSNFGAVRTGILGAALGYGTILADRSLNELTGGKAHESWNAEQLLGPMALVANKTWYGKTAGVAGSLVLSRLVDKGLGPASDKWNAPTGNTDWVDALGLGTTAVLARRIPNPLARMAVVGSGVIGAKIIHAIGDNTHGLKDTYEDTKDRTVDDSKERSASSLRRMTDAYTDLGNTRTDYLMRTIMASDAQMRANWNSKDANGQNVMTPGTKLLSYRQDAVMRRAYGDSELEKGTHILKNHTFDYVTPGLKLDLNGTAADLYIKSIGSINGAYRQTAGMIANNNDAAKPPMTLPDGSKPTQAELQPLLDYNKETKAKLDEIFNGKHDIPKAVDELAKFAGANTDDIRTSVIIESDRKILEYAKRGIDARDAAARAQAEGNTAVADLARADMVMAQRMLAKLYRDQAVAYLAMAQNKLEHGQDGGGAASLLFQERNNQQDILPNGQKRPYNGAQGALEMAIRFGGKDNPDLIQLVAKYNELAPKVGPTILSNIRNPNLNMLNVDNGLQR